MSLIPLRQRLKEAAERQPPAPGYWQHNRKRLITKAGIFLIAGTCTIGPVLLFNHYKDDIERSPDKTEHVNSLKQNKDLPNGDKIGSNIVEVDSALPNRKEYATVYSLKIDSLAHINRNSIDSLMHQLRAQFEKYFGDLETKIENAREPDLTLIARATSLRQKFEVDCKGLEMIRDSLSTYFAGGSENPFNLNQAGFNRRRDDLVHLLVVSETGRAYSKNLDALISKILSR